MTDRGLPIVDGAPACPFVAFEDDRDARAASPDHRHRCYAEVRPAPRALAHQEAYCLSSAFPVCPTFQDWARREAAHAREGRSAQAVSPSAPDAESGEPDDDEGIEPGSPMPRPLDAQRNPPRNWAAPPPWLSGAEDDGGDDDDRPVVGRPPGVAAAGAGLAGSFADQVAGGRAGPSEPRERPAPAMSERRDPPEERPAPRDERRPPEAAEHPDEGRPRRAAPRRAADGSTVAGPSWERPRRMEAYPTLKTRIGLPAISLPPILLGIVAVAIAAVALFYLPALLGIGNGPAATGTPGPSGAASLEPSATLGEPTPTPAPTEQIYVVQSGDTMSKIANRFGVPLATLIEANRDTIPNPDVLQIGQEVIIPTVAPSLLPDAGSPVP